MFTKILGWYGCQIRFVFLVFEPEKWGIERMRMDEELLEISKVT